MSTLGPLVRFEIVRRLRWRPLRWLVLAHPALVAATYGLASGPGPPLGTDVALMGAAIAWLFLLCFELGRDRELGMDALLTSNLVGSRTYVLAKILALGVVLFVYHAAVVGVVAAFAPDGLDEARQASGLLSLLAPLLPLVLLTELVVATRVPLIYVALVGGGAMLVSFWSGVDAETIVVWMGLDAGTPLPVRPVVVGIVGLVVLLPLAARRAAAGRPF